MLLSLVGRMKSSKAGRVIISKNNMAPEQFQGVVSKESDQYALGCIAYEMLTGHQAFTASNIQVLVGQLPSAAAM
jgi:serine/threonine protein kinase